MQACFRQQTTSEDNVHRESFCEHYGSRSLQRVEDHSKDEGGSKHPATMNTAACDFGIVELIDLPVLLLCVLGAVVCSLSNETASLLACSRSGLHCFQFHGFRMLPYCRHSETNRTEQGCDVGSLRRKVAKGIYWKEVRSEAWLRTKQGLGSGYRLITSIILPSLGFIISCVILRKLAITIPVTGMVGISTGIGLYLIVLFAEWCWNILRIPPERDSMRLRIIDERDAEIQKYHHPTIQLEFHPSDYGYLFRSHLARRDAMWVRVLPTTESHIEGCVGYLDDVFRWTGDNWKPIGLNGRRPLWWSEIHEQRLSTGERPVYAREVQIVSGSPQFLDIAFFIEDENILHVAVDAMPLEAAAVFEQYPDAIFKFNIRLIGEQHVNKTSAPELLGSDTLAKNPRKQSARNPVICRGFRLAFDP